ncbi:MAG: helix-turn-helix transcriptional regulator [Candidatus Thermoplasmatota archaeon]|nr:helix-turn-helix transcriptional regulator [Candidatus Thermoplasmatota archaeon]
MSYDLDFSLATSEQLEKLLCERIEQVRLSRNITQEMLAKEAGVSLRTIGRMAKGEGISLDTFIRLLIALGIQGNLKGLLPDPGIRPIDQVHLTGSERKRAHPADPDKENIPWAWGD